MNPADVTVCVRRQAYRGGVATLRHQTVGSPAPEGARYDGAGTNIAVYAPAADGVAVEVLDTDGGPVRVDLPARTGGTWHGYLPGVGPGTRYLLYASGPDSPRQGQVFDPTRPLIDPYALAVDTVSAPTPREHGLAAVVVDPAVLDRRARSARPNRPWSQTVIYELHVRGFTRTHPQLPEALRGTYAGLAHPAVVDYLLDLGVTAVELLPVAQHVTEPPIASRQARNYWGYSPIAPLAVHGGYASAGTRGQQVTEFVHLVDTLHAAGLELIVDVVLNHLGEDGPDWPAWSVRGLAADRYYRLAGSGRFLDMTGCGNTLDLSRPAALRLAMDALRHWATLGVDGFRFDLATTLARGASGAFEAGGSFLAAVGQDPVLRERKLIAEPWDLGYDGYQLGAFPPPWAEWNDRYRDDVRRFWLAGQRPHAVHPGVRALGYRLSGSSDVFDGVHHGHHERGPLSSVNFVTAHDGKTLADLVTYEAKHNHANGEGNRDGGGEDLSWNAGVEGPSDDPAVQRRRAHLSASMLATLLLSTGVPMLLAGDERGRTQHGNDNAYCQDNEISWVDWRPSPLQQRLTRLVQVLTSLRREHPVLRQADFFNGTHPTLDTLADLAWFAPDGTRMSHERWQDPDLRTLSWYLAGDAVTAETRGAPTASDVSCLIVLNGHLDDVPVVLPGGPWADGYRVLADTAALVDDGSSASCPGTPVPVGEPIPPGRAVCRPGLSVAVYEALRSPQA